MKQPLTYSEFIVNYFITSADYPTPMRIWDTAFESGKLQCDCIDKCKTEKCPACGGSGNDPNHRHGSIDDCDYCHGVGRIIKR